MSVFIKTFNNLLSGNLDKIGKNIILDSGFVLNPNNYSIIHENNSMIEFEKLKADTPPTGILYNIKQLEADDDVKNYFYSCLRIGLFENQIQELTNVEEYLFANASENSTSKLVNMNDYIINKFFNENNNIDFESISDIKTFVNVNISNYLNILKEICVDDRALFRYIPVIFNLKNSLSLCETC